MGLSGGLPTQGETHLWFAPEKDIEIERLRVDGLACLSAEEVGRLNNFGNRQRANRFLIGRTFMRRVLADYLNINPAALVFGQGDNGKPVLKTPDLTGIDFNLSHASGETVLAISNASAIGVDLEPVSRTRTAWRICQHFFSAPEHQRLADLEGPGTLHPLMHWCLKESIAKAQGGTIWQTLDDVSFRLETNRIYWDGGVPNSALWSLSCGIINYSFVIAVAQKNMLINSGLEHSILLCNKEKNRTIRKPFCPKYRSF